MKKIAIDLDMVLVDHVPYFKSIFKKHGFNGSFQLPTDWSFSNYPPVIKEEILADYTSPDCEVVTTKFPIFPGVLKTLKYLKCDGFYLEIVSSRIDSERNRNYIEVNFPMIDKITLLGLDTIKVDYINENNFDYWIDDYPKGYERLETCRVILTSNDETLYNHYMRKDLVYFKSLNSICKRLADIIRVHQLGKGTIFWGNK